jgi:hypothetical protein
VVPAIKLLIVSALSHDNSAQKSLEVVELSQTEMVTLNC